MNLISRLEEQILVSIWRLQEKAYGIAILEEMTKTTGKNWLTGSIYASLARLLKQNLIEAIEGDPTPKRGGRRKIFYRVTETGQKALNELQRVHVALWAGLPSFEIEDKDV
ncbi:PadR family transcriptional regulator [Acidobacteriota bacterium]